MKHKIPSFLESVLLSLLCAAGAVGCLVTAMHLQVDSIGLCSAAVAAWSLFCSLMLLRRRGLTAVLVLAAVLCGVVYYHGDFGVQLRSLLAVIAKAYDAGYGWGIPDFLRVEAGPADLPLVAIGMLIAFSVSRTVCRRKGNGLSIVLMMLPLGACLVVTDTVPSQGSLFLLLLSLALLLLTDSVRRESGNQGTRLTAFSLIPVVLALGVMFYLVPRESYQNRTADLRERLMTYAMKLPEKIRSGELGAMLSPKTEEQVDLSALTSQPRLGLPVAEVIAEQDGPVYLRTQDYDEYTGTSWISTPGRVDYLGGSGEGRGLVTVRTLTAQGSLLLPSFPDGQTFLTDGRADNAENQLEYTLDCRESSMGAYPAEEWLALPQQTDLRAKELLRTIPGDLSTIEQAANTIAQYVRSSAVYSRRASTMPADADDFALWFLEQGETGYCVHFATAAAVLLRSAGIPARYVTGYRVMGRAGEPVKVTSDEAHAWVEYYNYRTWNWEILEPTPADLSQLPTEPATQATQPAPTQAEQPTQPEASEPRQSQPEKQPEPPAAPVHWEILLIPAALLLVIAAVEVQRLIRIRLRRNRQLRGDNNHRAGACWQEVRLLTALLKTTAPEELVQLAEKAAFSQHELTEEELQCFAAYQTQARRKLKAAPWWKRPVYRYVYAMI